MFSQTCGSTERYKCSQEVSLFLKKRIFMRRYADEAEMSRLLVFMRPSRCSRGEEILFCTESSWVMLLLLWR